jgi:hypothetical protein
MALTHLATAFVFTLLSVPYFVLSLWIYRTRRFVKSFLCGMGLGAGLAGFYLFPAALEKKFVHTDEVLTQGPLWDFSKNFLFTYLDRDKDDGYAWGIFDHRYYEVSNGLFSIAAFICFFILIVNMDKVKKMFTEHFRITAALIMFSLCFIMMTPVSIFAWAMLKPMQTIQFPWRYTAFILPFGVLIMAYAFDLVGKLSLQKFYVAGYKFLFLIMFGVFGLLGYVDFINMYNWKWVPEQSLLKAALYVLWGNEEYRPNLDNNPNWKQTNFRQDFSPVIRSSDPSCDIEILEWYSHKKIFEVFSIGGHQIRLRTFYFPGWNVYIDGKPAEIRMDTQTGAMIIQIPGGKHEIAVKFENTPIRKVSLYISIFSLLFFLFLLSKLKKSIVPIEWTKESLIGKKDEPQLEVNLT